MRKAWCRGCGSQGTYATGWCLLREEDLEALQEALGRPIQTQQVLTGGMVLARLRARHLRCVHCHERGLLVGGFRPTKALDRVGAGRPN